MGASRWIGRGDKNAADQAAVDSDAPDGEHGLDAWGRRDRRGREGRGTRCSSTARRSETGRARRCDVAVDPLEGTRLDGPRGSPARSACSRSRSAGRAASRERHVYMDKIAVGPRGGRRHRHRRLAERERQRASPRRRAGPERRDGGRPRARKRHDDLIAELRESGRAGEPDPRRRRCAVHRSGDSPARAWTC